jgi:hypothetical protein
MSHFTKHPILRSQVPFFVSFSFLVFLCSQSMLLAARRRSEVGGGLSSETQHSLTDSACGDMTACVRALTLALCAIAAAAATLKPVKGPVQVGKLKMSPIGCGYAHRRVIFEHLFLCILLLPSPYA